MMKKTLVLALGLFMLAGCVAYQAVDPNESINISNRFNVSPQIAWAKQTAVGSKDTIWTADGVELNVLRFIPLVEDGDALIRQSGRKSEDIVPYKDDMLPNDVADLFVTDLTKLGYQGVSYANLAPASFAGDNGFRFDLTLSTPGGLNMTGKVLASQRNGGLDAILFMAPSEYYFGRYAQTVEQIFKSVKAAS